ncbi:MAG: multicopper oxidase domain-containing protein [Acidimicrobiales bacterium]
MSSTSGWSRRRFLISTSAGAAGLWLGGCSSGSTAGTVGVSASDIAIREAQRVVSGAGSKVVDLTAGPVELDLAGRRVRTVAYNGLVPGPEIRVRAGDELTVNLKNELTTPTTIHWHGLAIRNDMDGVPNVTQDPTAAGGLFTYRFVVPDPGTHWFHPHMGLDLDRGMYAPIIVEDPSEPGEYDVESVIVLDDWLDDIDGNSPEMTFAALLEDGGMGGMSGMMGGGSDMGAME